MSRAVVGRLVGSSRPPLPQKHGWDSVASLEQPQERAFIWAPVRSSMKADLLLMLCVCNMLCFQFRVVFYFQPFDLDLPFSIRLNNYLKLSSLSAHLSVLS